MTKNYVKNGITYHFSHAARKWEFNAGSFTLIQACGGAQAAHRVAGAVSGAHKRAKGNLVSLDAIARGSIAKFVGA